MTGYGRGLCESSTLDGVRVESGEDDGVVMLCTIRKSW